MCSVNVIMWIIHLTLGWGNRNIQGTCWWGRRSESSIRRSHTYPQGQSLSLCKYPQGQSLSLCKYPQSQSLCLCKYPHSQSTSLCKCQLTLLCSLLLKCFSWPPQKFKRFSQFLNNKELTRLWTADEEKRGSPVNRHFRGNWPKNNNKYKSQILATFTMTMITTSNKFQYKIVLKIFKIYGHFVKTITMALWSWWNKNTDCCVAHL